MFLPEDKGQSVEALAEANITMTVPKFGPTGQDQHFGVERLDEAKRLASFWPC